MAPDTSFSRQAAKRFADKYAKARSEKQLAQSFWRDFFVAVCGVDDLLAAGVEFEYPVRSASSGTINFIDVLWPGIVLVEHKSAGQDLDKAEAQARDYLVSLDPALRPPAFVISDFTRIRVVEVFSGTSVEFPLEDLPQHLARFEAIVGKRARGAVAVETTADRHAAHLMSRLFIECERAGYGGHDVSVLLVRVLFLLFGDDTRMWRRNEAGLFEMLMAASPPGGAGLGGLLQELFQVLDTPVEDRPSTLDARMVDFPYVNGGLFAEVLPVFAFTSEMRQALVEASQYNWSQISPAIFGSMFQTIKSKEARRDLGEHFTSEANILKVIGPLFLHDLNERLSKAWHSATSLRRLQSDLGTLQFLDPACGCGNFLLVAYKRLREMELKILVRLQELEGTQGVTALDGTWNLRVHLSQFHGIEREEWSSQIATVAMFLADHQVNLAMEEISGMAPSRFPLREAANIVHGNALDVDWGMVAPMGATTFIMGNPPFLGNSLLSDEQKADRARVWDRVVGSGNLDYVACWYLVAARHISVSGAHAAFVSTNSITQGQQPPVLWGELYRLGVHIDFAHRTFAWDNDDRGKAAVHCVIIGFSASTDRGLKALWSYDTPRGEAALTMARNINAYLIDGPDVLVTQRRRPLVPHVQPMIKGSQPTDEGVLSNLSAAEAEDIRQTDPIAGKYLRRIVGAREVLNGGERFCLWLRGADPGDIRTSAVLRDRVRFVREFRMRSTKAATRESAARPAEFQEIRQPKTEYLAVPLHTSEDRDYVPVARFGPDVIATNAVSVIPDASLVTFGLLQSRPFTLWNKAVSGRLESRTRVSNTITYNNFPFPALTGDRRAAVEVAAQDVLDVRQLFPTSTLADLYDRVAMPPALRKSHDALDRAALAAFDLKPSATDDTILTRLFERYVALLAGAAVL